ncbi:MAG: PEP-CTERM sorting domain-containing protein [Planctomycetota bacterium]|nr:MAG: PEP-CTERM sorting domain-containing protein [Planctomycetota bacterium]
MRTRFALPVCTGLLFSLATSAFAVTVQVRDAVGGESNNGPEPGYFKEDTARGGDPRGTYSNGPTEQLFSGMFDFEMRMDGGGDGPPPQQEWQELLTYCAEPFQGVGFDINPPDDVGLPYEIVPLAGTNGITPDEAVFLEILWANAFPLTIPNPGDDVTEASARASAFQILVWEVNQDDSIDLTTNDGVNQFRLTLGDSFTNRVYDIAQEWIDLIQTEQWTERTTLYALVSDYSQDLLTTVPEPASALSLLAGLLLVGRRR